MTQAAPPIPTVRAQSQSTEPRGRSSGRGGRGAFRGHGGFKKGSRKASGGNTKGMAPTGVTKSKSTSSRNSGSSFGGGTSKHETKGGGFGSRGIGMMPI